MGAYSDLAQPAAPTAAPPSGSNDYSDLASPTTADQIAKDTVQYQSAQKTVFLADKNTTFGYPESMAPADAEAAIREKAYSIPITVPSYIRDQGSVSPPEQPQTANARSLTPTSGIDPLYPVERIISETLEKPAWAVTNLALRTLGGVYKYGPTPVVDKFLAEGLKNKSPEWLDQAVDFYSNPEENAPITSLVSPERQALRAQAYHRNYALGIAGDIAENVTDFMGFLLPLSTAEKLQAASKGAQLVSDAPFLAEFAKSTARLSGYAFMRTNGSVTERGKAALSMLGYSMAPYIANATGATGIGAAGIAAALNAFVSSPTYARALNEAGGVNREFAAMVIPQAVMDIAFAWHTRGLAENIRNAKIEKYFKDRAKEMKLPAAEAKTMLQGVLEALKNTDTLPAQPRLDNPDADNEYVKNEPITITLGANDKKTSNNLRVEFSGVKNEQILRGNHLADEIKRMVPEKIQRSGLFWFKAADGDTGVLLDALTDESPKWDPYRKELEAALNLSPEAMKALDKINRFYDEAGRVSTEIGTIQDVRDNYQARLYSSEKPKDFIKSTPQSGLKQTTPHSLERAFDTEFDAVNAGRKFLTTDITDTLSMYNQEMATVNTARKLADLLVEHKMAIWTTGNKVGDGWKQVGTLKRSKVIEDATTHELTPTEQFLMAPRGLADGMAAIADPNFVKQIDVLRGIQKYQGLVKTANLAYSFFHHISMAAQTLYQGGVRTLMHLPNMEKMLESAPFADLEKDFGRHGGITTKIEANQDILRKITEQNGDTFSKAVNLPGVKQSLDVANLSADFLFGHVQRFMKVSDYGAKITEWVSKHPTATNEQVKTAKQGLAKEINAAYGGMNWEAMGMTKSNLALLRLGLLAPDWFTANASLIKYAFSDTGTAGGAARANLLTAFVGGTILTEGLNKILTGHFTDENKKGHQLEVEISPDVYVSFFRAGIGELLTAGSMVAEGGVSGGVTYLSHKLAPFPKAAVKMLDAAYTAEQAGKGPVAGTYDVLKALFQSAGPVPFGVSNFLKYIKEQDATIHGSLAVLSGVARYSNFGNRGGKKKPRI